MDKKVIQRIVLGHVFTPMSRDDWETYAGADEFSFIKHLDDRDLLLSPDGTISEVMHDGDKQRDWTCRAINSDGEDWKDGVVYETTKENKDSWVDDLLPPLKAAKRFYAFAENSFSCLRELTENEAANLTEFILVEVTPQPSGAFRLELDQYYCSGGQLVLEVTQPLERALATFSALLRADAKLEEEECLDFQQKRNRG